MHEMPVIPAKRGTWNIDNDRNAWNDWNAWKALSKWDAIKDVRMSVVQVMARMTVITGMLGMIRMP